MFPEITRDDVFTLETRRLWLRWPRAADAPAIARLAGDREVAEKTAHIPHPYPPEAADQFIYQARLANCRGEGLVLALTPKGRPGDVIGMIGLHPRGDGPQLGYWLGKPHWGRGCMTEAARVMVDTFFLLVPAEELLVSALTTNAGSRRVIEKTGFAHTGKTELKAPARNFRFVVDTFRLAREEWQAGRPMSRNDSFRVITSP